MTQTILAEASMKENSVRAKALMGVRAGGDEEMFRWYNTEKRKGNWTDTMVTVAWGHYASTRQPRFKPVLGAAFLTWMSHEPMYVRSD